VMSGAMSLRDELWLDMSASIPFVGRLEAIEGLSRLPRPDVCGPPRGI
jgi:hypothetical protein